MSELDKRINAIYTVNDLYDIVGMINKTDDAALKEGYSGALTRAVLKKISEGNPNSEAMAKIVLKHLES